MTKTIDSTAYVTGYQYNFAGEITSMTYPSGRVVTNGYDAIGRLSQVSSGGINYLYGATYNAAHQPTAFGYGNGVTANFSYNARMQLQTLSYSQFVFPAFNPVLSLTYNYAHPNGGNTGQITGITDNLDNGRSVAYAYDEWSRLKTAQSVGSGNYPQWAMNWVYDRYGNRTNQNGTAGGAPSMQTVVNANTNRVTQMNGVAVQHDVSGNMTQDDINTYNYDGENRMIQSPPGSPYPAIFNAYDGAGLRVKKTASSGTSTTRILYSGTKEIAHYVNTTAPGSPTYEFIYAGSQLVAVTGGTPQAPWQRYLHQDHLSPRVITNETGTPVRNSGHYPFGEMWYEQGGNTPLKFTTYERDVETGLDYAIFRFHAPRLGRFQIPDLLAGSAFSPQSLNRYAYVMNDPINLVDPLGLEGCPPGCTPLYDELGTY
ncbi:MAG: RHS repeat-associated core domain-containing protein, partial [Candidatus Acidiferrales bacterium]